MDPFTALGVAGNIVQFVDFAAKLISKSREIYHSVDGASSQHLDLQEIASNLNRLNGRLQEDLRHQIVSTTAYPSLGHGGSGRAEKELGVINTKCAEEAGKLISALKVIRVKGSIRSGTAFGKPS
ncbi:uncharacterized protein BP5553_06555 [Venustampulla echinocandica]|uniref:Fungal N-terminal domain-containing protein n=1 Tax=Venustampulla echinocandica TaxID=2656787 RepID=A0A370TK94_9HELO|nr:uncharacterized protein BP5553_06555 [Venustampulla echinocandica]RDL35943.1 hypothetical protein BP5553_06555 [Venustampulla echinocandica]